MYHWTKWTNVQSVQESYGNQTSVSRNQMPTEHTPQFLTQRTTQILFKQCPSISRQQFLAFKQRTILQTVQQLTKIRRILALHSYVITRGILVHIQKELHFFPESSYIRLCQYLRVKYIIAIKDFYIFSLDGVLKLIFTIFGFFSNRCLLLFVQ